MKNTNRSTLRKDGVSYVLPFTLVTSCFALWGFINDITNPAVKAFSKIFHMSVTDEALVQVAFYGGYFVMVFPVAILVRKYSYRAGILLGLGLYASGALLFFSAKVTGDYYPFLLAYSALTCGLSFLETSANPYISSMGTEGTATRQLNLVQSFNPMGSLLRMYITINFTQACLNPMDTVEHSRLPPSRFEVLGESDLSVLIVPYLIIGLMILAMLFLIRTVKMSKNGGKNHNIDFIPTLKRILRAHHYREGVIAQFFYVDAQTTCWTSVIQYEIRLFMLQGMEGKAAEMLPQEYNITAVVILCISRFVCIFILHYLNPGTLLKILATAGGASTLGVVFLQNVWGLYCLVTISACMPLMLPTVYGTTLRGLGDDVKFGAADLIMAVLEGSVLPPLQACVIDQHMLLDMPAVSLSFILPLIYFVVIITYEHRTCARAKRIKAAQK